MPIAHPTLNHLYAKYVVLTVNDFAQNAHLPNAFAPSIQVRLRDPERKRCRPMAAANS